MTSGQPFVWPVNATRPRIIFNQSKVSLNQKRQRKDWLIRHIPVKVKGRSPRPYRVPKLISSIVMGVCLYLAVHLNAGPRYQVCIFLSRVYSHVSFVMGFYRRRTYKDGLGVHSSRVRRTG